MAHVEKIPDLNEKPEGDCGDDFSQLEWLDDVDDSLMDPNVECRCWMLMLDAIVE